MDIYKSILKKGSLFHLKTDNDQFFKYTLEVLGEMEIEDLVETEDLDSSVLKE